MQHSSACASCFLLRDDMVPMCHIVGICFPTFISVHDGNQGVRKQSDPIRPSLSSLHVIFVTGDK